MWGTFWRRRRSGGHHLGVVFQGTNLFRDIGAPTHDCLLIAKQGPSWRRPITENVRNRRRDGSFFTILHHLAIFKGGSCEEIVYIGRIYERLRNCLRILLPGFRAALQSADSANWKKTSRDVNACCVFSLLNFHPKNISNSDESTTLSTRIFIMSAPFFSIFWKDHFNSKEVGPFPGAKTPLHLFWRVAGFQSRNGFSNYSHVEICFQDFNIFSAALWIYFLLICALSEVGIKFVRSFIMEFLEYPTRGSRASTVDSLRFVFLLVGSFCITEVCKLTEYNYRRLGGSLMIFRRTHFKEFTFQWLIPIVPFPKKNTPFNCIRVDNFLASRATFCKLNYIDSGSNDIVGGTNETICSRPICLFSHFLLHSKFKLAVVPFRRSFPTTTWFCYPDLIWSRSVIECDVFVCLDLFERLFRIGSLLFWVVAARCSPPISDEWKYL
jgi:hypothetical protein